MASRKKVMLQVLDGNWGTTAYNDERWINLKGFDTVEEALKNLNERCRKGATASFRIKKEDGTYWYSISSGQNYEIISN